MPRSAVLLPIPGPFDKLVRACDDRPMRPKSEGEPGQDLEAQARSLHLEFDYAGAMRAYEHAYAAYRREGDLLAAARAARTLGWFHGSVYGDWAVYRGWVGRAVSLLEQAGVDSNEHGWVLLAQAQAGGGLDVQKRRYEDAIATARRCQDGDLECEALASLGITLAFSGHVAAASSRLTNRAGGDRRGRGRRPCPASKGCSAVARRREPSSDWGEAEQWLRAVRVQCGTGARDRELMLHARSTRPPRPAAAKAAGVGLRIGSAPVRAIGSAQSPHLPAGARSGPNSTLAGSPLVPPHSWRALSQALRR